MSEDITGTDEFKAALEAEVAGLKKNRDEAIERHKELQQRLKAYDGIDPDEYEKLLEAREAAEAEKAKAAGDWEKLQARLDKKLAEKDAIIADLSKRNENTWREREALAAIAKHGGNVTLLRGIVSQALRVEADGDGYSVHAVVDGENMDATAYVAHLKEQDEYAGAFAPAGTSGSGSRKSEKMAGGIQLPDGIEIIN